ncbi:N-carbamoyl-L-amino-acid hydrolase [Thalassobacillus cyri]|uniref:N-carbamoyl-L-amino-acid hydrolase n=1 Tax=Thalassobacillus cyri TaxID=571932 RepID=A0A1H3XZJ4_9BACI|nr:M20 family metallo-hydrolase [Thalassobacillus cyri]SEA04251.1 N-carbamoyl-L-amino-acid hydrolase [Thalassobacillus cyri]
MSEDSHWLEEKLLQLNQADTMDQPRGFTRLSYSPEESRSHEAFQQIANELDLQVTSDKAGNQWAVWKVDSLAPTVAVGSHLDTVNAGGGYDGVAGVLCGLGAIKQMKHQSFTPKKNIAVICFASEESARFGVSTIGSKAVTGLLDKQELENVTDGDGVTIKQAIEEFGLDWETIEQAEKAPDELESFLELHIEQGVQIEHNGAEIGIVRGVACPIRLKVTAIGMSNHTGTTPMDNRKDAFAAIAPLVNFVEQEANKINTRQEVPLVATVSTVQLKPNAMNVIPGEVELGIDIRSVDDSSKYELADLIKSYCSQVETKRQITIKVETLVNNDSIFLAPQIQEKLQKVSKRLGYKALLMDSGAGHDVMNMAVRWPSGLIFIPCKEGISHHPKEYASIADLQKGSNIMAAYLQEETGDDDEDKNWSNQSC